MGKRAKIWPFDIAPPTNQSFGDIDIWVILKASIASKIMLKIKKPIKCFWDIFENVDFYSQNKLKRGPGPEVDFLFQNLALSLLSIYDD